MPCKSKGQDDRDSGDSGDSSVSDDKIESDNLHTLLSQERPLFENYKKNEFYYNIMKLGLTKKRMDNGDIYYCGLQMKRREVIE